MYPKITTKIQNGKVYRYLSLVESYRDNGKVRQKLIYSFGAITDPVVKSRIDSLLYKLRKYSTGTLFKPEEVSCESSQLFGQPLIGKLLWDKLQISEAIKELTCMRKTEFDISLYSLVLVLNRLIAPKSDLATSIWYKQIYLKELEDKELELHNFYRALDCLYEIKERLENRLFNRLCDLFTLKVNIVFYDLTSTYFEGEGPEIAQYGHSKDGKPGCHQILLALIITEEGFPIGCEIYPGNYPETYTMSNVLENLSKRFQIARCIFVCDRGLVSKRNLKDIKEHNYQYIVAVKSRDKDIIKIIDPDIKTYTKIDDNIFAKKINVSGKRFIVYHNQERALKDEKERNELLERITNSLENLAKWYSQGEIKSQKEVITRISNILSSEKKRKFITYKFEGNKFIFKINQKVVAQEKLLDGKTILHTDVLDLPLKKIVESYKSLSRIENCFRDIKSLLKLRPLRHYTEKRVKAHIFVCVIALLLERILEEFLARKKYPITATQALDSLGEVKITTNILKNETREFRIKCITPIEGKAAKILGFFGLSKIQRAIITEKPA